MAGTIQPIAALTVDDHGPINSVVSVILPAASIFFTTIRLVTHRQKRLRYEPDDLIFGVALCFGIAVSIVSHFCVRAGLGRHQQKLDDDMVERYFKLFWTTQLLGIIALACSKLSTILMFKRIDPVRIGPQTMKWLLPMLIAYCLIAFFLIGFQCQLPRPWVLSPANCSTHGKVYYPVTISNILTDTLLAFWIIPALWELQMTKHAKRVVTWLFVSRFALCIADIGRMFVIHKALQSEDQTRSQLLWAVMDQIVVHLSINHATLPRIQIFLSNLQTGFLDMTIPVNDGTANSSHPRSHSCADDGDDIRSPKTSRTGRSKSNGRERRWSKLRSWSALNTLSSKSTLSKTPSISEHPLRLLPEQGIELSTTVYTGDGESTRSNGPQNSSYNPTLPSQGLAREYEEGKGQLRGVRVQKEIKMAYDKVSDLGPFGTQHKSVSGLNEHTPMLV